MRKKTTKQDDQNLAIRICGRNEQFERNGGGQWVAVNRPHKNKKKYDRKNNKKEIRNNLLYFLRKCYFFCNFVKIISIMDLQSKRAEGEMKYKDDDLVFITIAIDFDGTCVEHRFPKIGRTIPNCVETLKRWNKEYNVAYILDTMRGGKELEDAIQWFKDNNIPLFGVGKHPTQSEWTDSPKAHARFSIDDRNVGQPLMLDSSGYMPCVDWEKTVEIFEPTIKHLWEILEQEKQT